MSNYVWIDNLYSAIKWRYDDNKSIITLYAFNGTWKTLLSKQFDSLNTDDNIRVLRYNAFFEDLFYWDNESSELKINEFYDEYKIIQSEWLEKNIAEIFKRILNTKIEPEIDFEERSIKFNFASWDERAENWIKISRWEESIFIWSIFLAILEEALSQLTEDEPSDYFKNIEYIVIDDPVSSMDDNRIISLAVDLINLIADYKKKEKTKNLNLDEWDKKNIKFLITTHHALFYNVLYNSFREELKKNNSEWLVLFKNWYDNYTLDSREDSPFWYHILVLKEIKRAIDNWNIQKYHYNLFRWLLEKTAVFVWEKSWKNCLNNINWIEEQKEIFIKKLNEFSHNRVEIFEYRELSDEDKEIFTDVFNGFIEKYKFTS